MNDHSYILIIILYSTNVAISTDPRTSSSMGNSVILYSNRYYCGVVRFLGRLVLFGISVCKDYIPCDVLVTDWRNESVDLLVLETLVPKTLLQQYVSLVMDSKRLVLSGPSGTGKSYLAARLAQHVVLR